MPETVEASAPLSAGPSGRGAHLMLEIGPPALKMWPGLRWTTSSAPTERQYLLSVQGESAKGTDQVASSRTSRARAPLLPCRRPLQAPSRPGDARSQMCSLPSPAAACPTGPRPAHRIRAAEREARLRADQGCPAQASRRRCLRRRELRRSALLAEQRAQRGEPDGCCRLGSEGRRRGHCEESSQSTGVYTSRVK